MSFLMTVLDVNARSPFQEVLSSVQAVTATLDVLAPEVGPGTRKCCPIYPWSAIASARLYEVWC